MSKVTSCLSTIIQPSDELVKQFANYLLGAIADHSDILIISPDDGLVKIEEELEIARMLIEIAYPEISYLKYTLHYDKETEELDFLPSNQFTEQLVDRMRELEFS